MGARPDQDETHSEGRRPGFLGRLFPRKTGREEPIPRRVGRYRVVELIGEGGMGRVYLAEDETLRRKVALKTLKRTDRQSRRRFVREARAAAQVSHPNLCPIFEVGEQAGRPFLAMELLAGETLAARLRRGALGIPEALDLAEDLLAALAALHDAGVVHRDLKPSNVFLTAHGARILDFGLARALPDEVVRALTSSSDMSLPGLIVGTPGYMAPEQILGKPVDVRADIFAVAAILYEALSQRPPFRGDSVAQSLSTTLYDDPPPLDGSPALRALDASIRRALAKKAAERPGSARELLAALREAARAAEGAALPPGRETFVGRESELAFLEERFDAAAGGAGGVVFVTGERGVGKSALVAEFIRRVRQRPAPVTLVAGRCAEARGPGEAFLPFLDALGRLLASRARDVTSELLRTYAPTICVQMPAGLVPDPDGSLRRQAAGATKERLIREAGDFMKAAGRGFPTVFLIEDLQWADSASVDLLHHLGCRLARQRTLLLGTFRNADVDSANLGFKRAALDLVARGAARELGIGALRGEDVAAYLDARFAPHRLPGALADAIFARTEGLALFVRSLVDVLVERGDIARDEQGYSLACALEALDLEPTKGLQELVRQQLDGLPAGEREVLEAASVSGREFLSPVVARLVGRDELPVEEELRRLCRVRRLIVEAREETLPDGTLATRYRFAHALYQTVLRDGLVASRRVDLHRRVAARLRHHWGAEARRLAVEIARHHEEGHDHEGAIVFRGHAGDNAARRFAYAEAEEHYDWAFRSVAHVDARSRAGALLSLLRRRGTVRLAQARFADAAADFEELLRVARETGSAEDARAALAGLCDALFFARRPDQMAQRARELLDATNGEGSGPGGDEALARMAQVLVSEGRFAEAVPMLDRVILSARGSQPKALEIALSYRALVHYFQTEFAQAETTAVEALSVATQLGDGFYALGARMLLGLARAKLGRLSEAIDDFDDAITAARRNDDHFWLPRLYSHLGWAHRELGAFELARQHDATSVRLASEHPAAGSENEAIVNVAMDEIAAGRPRQGAELLAELPSKTSEDPWLRWLSQLRVAAAAAHVSSACEDWRGVEAHAARLADLAQRVGALDYLATSERLRGEAALAGHGPIGVATERLSAALAALHAKPAPLEAWRGWRILALLQSRRGDDDAARAAAAEAARTVRAIGSGIRDDALRNGFLALPAVREVLQAADARPVAGPSA